MSRAELAELRRGVGRAPGEKPMLWGTILTNLPEEFYGRNGEPSRAEWAIYIALTMFALHQQGHDIKTECMHADKIDTFKGINFSTTNKSDILGKIFYEMDYNKVSPCKF